MRRIVDCRRRKEGNVGVQTFNGKWAATKAYANVMGLLLRLTQRCGLDRPLLYVLHIALEIKKNYLKEKRIKTLS